MNFLTNLLTNVQQMQETPTITPTILIVFGIFFIVIGFAFFGLFPMAKRKANKYKKNQLELYKEQNRRVHITYEETGMYLPPWEKVKVFYPLFLGLVFIIIGISLIVKAIF